MGCVSTGVVSWTGPRAGSSAGASASGTLERREPHRARRRRAFLSGTAGKVAGELFAGRPRLPVLLHPLHQERGGGVEVEVGVEGEQRSEAQVDGEQELT